MGTQIYNSQLASEIAANLLEIGAIKLSPSKPFTWTSGWKSPIYCDNRLILSNPSVRTKIKDALGRAISSFSGIDAVVGVATAGIPQGALVADKLGLPFLYVRSKPKEHGLQKMIEGKLEKGQKVVVVEDHVSTGGSSLAVAEALKEAGAEVSGIVTIFTYGFPLAEDNMNTRHVKLVALSDYDHLLDYAREKGMLNNEMLKTLKEWRADPANWS